LLAYVFVQHQVSGAAVLCAAVASLAIGCAGYAEVDGYQAAYVDNPPTYIEYYPRYPFDDGYVYEVDGRYYHRHHGHWAVYRSPPPEIRYVRPEVRIERGRAEHQRDVR
jgi:hypothetical protein